MEEAFSWIKNVFGTLFGKKEDEENPCTTGECKGSLAKLKSAQAEVTNACAWWAFLHGLLLAALAIIRAWPFMLALFVLCLFIMPSVAAVILLMFIMAFLLLITLGPAMEAVVEILGRARLAEEDAIQAAIEVCPPECVRNMVRVECDFG